MAERLSGGCLCGAVRFTAAPEKLEMSVCHCTMCRRWTGGVLMSVRCQDSVEIEDAGSQLGVYVTSDWGERCFCKACGTSLFWRARKKNQASVAVSAFHDPARFAFVREIYIDEKPPNYTFANVTTQVTRAQFEAKYASQSGA